MEWFVAKQAVPLCKEYLYLLEFYSPRIIVGAINGQLVLSWPAANSDFVLEGARDGRSVAELMRDGATALTRAQVMEGVAEMIREIQVEATFHDGTKLVTVHEPIRGVPQAGVTPGELAPADGEIEDDAALHGLGWIVPLFVAVSALTGSCARRRRRSCLRWS